MVIIDIGHTNIKTFNSTTKKYQKFDITKIKIFENYLVQNKNLFFYIGSVNKKINIYLCNFFKKYKIKHYFISHQDFKNKVNINKEINFNEIGLDILSIIYFIEDQNYFFINSGTALLYIKYTNQLDGVIISNNIFFDSNNLATKTQLKYNYSNHYSFATNTSLAFSAALTLYFVNSINFLLQQNNLVKKIYFNGVDRKYTNDIKCKKVFLENTTLKGYIKLVNYFIKSEGNIK